MDFPNNLKYTKNDEWLRVEGGVGTAGVTDYAQEQLSDIVYVEILARVGAQLAAGATCAAVESVKAAAEVYIPVSGKVLAVNEGLAEKPELINSSPYEQAWMVRFEIADSTEVDGLMDAAAYQTYCEERSH